MQDLQSENFFEEMSRCYNLVNHIKTHERDVKIPLLAFVKREVARKSATITIKKIKQEPLHVKQTFSKRKKRCSMNTYKGWSSSAKSKPFTTQSLDRDFSHYVIPTLVILVPRDADREMP